MRPRRVSLAMLEKELQHETGAVILRHQKKIEETCRQQSRELLDHHAATICGRAHGRIDDQ